MIKAISKSDRRARRSEMRAGRSAAASAAPQDGANQYPVSAMESAPTTSANHQMHASQNVMMTQHQSMGCDPRLGCMSQMNYPWPWTHPFGFPPMLYDPISYAMGQR